MHIVLVNCRLWVVPHSRGMLIIEDLVWFGFIVLNATSNNSSVISWWSVLLVEETEVPEENH